MQNALANLNAPVSAGSALEAYAGGQAFGERIRLKKALAAYSVNPDDPEALRTITELDTALGAKLREEQRDRQFNQAAVGYFEGDNALARGRVAMPPQPQNALAALPPVRPGQSFNEAFAPVANGQQGIVATPEQEAQSRALERQFGMEGATASDGEQELDFSPLGQPRSQQDAAFLDMLRIDAKRAFEIDSEMRDRAADRLKQQREAYGFAVQRLGGVKDNVGYQAALQDIQYRIEPLGVKVTDFLPPRYPGPDRLKEIRLSAIDADDQMRIFLQEANIQADNERADRNTDSLINTREGRLDEYRRHNRAKEGNTRRGQDLTDRRSRRSGRGGGGRGSSPPTATGPNGEKYVLRNGKWVQIN